MTILFQYNSTTNSMLLKKNNIIISGPTECEGPPPDDRNVTLSYIGKSRFSNDDYFDGMISRLFVADETLRTVSHACGCAQSRVCDSMQSSRRQDSIEALDGSSMSCSQTWKETSPWWRVDLEAPRLVVAIRIYNSIDCCQEDFEIRVGNWPAWENNPACATHVKASPDASWVEVMCQAEGRYVFIVLPGSDRYLRLCEVEVVGLLNNASTAIGGLIPNCTACIAGE